MALVDIGSGLWRWAHNGSGSLANPPTGWHADLDMLELGRGDFNMSGGPGSQGDTLARAHFAMWLLLQAPLILGNEMASGVEPHLLAMLLNADAHSINQDAWQAGGRRVAIGAPANASLGASFLDSVAVLAPCNASDPLQRWSWAWPGPAAYTFLEPCDAGSALQAWSFAPPAPGAPSLLRNTATGGCAAARNGTWDPAVLVPCDASDASQLWQLQGASGHLVAATGLCLDVYNFAGPDVDVYTCKPAGQADANQVWSWTSDGGGGGGGRLRSNTTGAAAGWCLAAAPGPAAADAAPLFVANPWAAVGAQPACLGAFGASAEGQWQAVPCTPGSTGGAQPFRVASPDGGATFTLTAPSGLAAGWNNQVGASGPRPHTRYVAAAGGGGGRWLLDLDALTDPALGGTLIQAAASDILDDDGVGGVGVGGDFCLALSTMGGLEAWAVPLSPAPAPRSAPPPARARYALALLNRSPADDDVSVSWAQLPGAGPQWPPPGPAAAFDAVRVWDGQRTPSVVGGITRRVPAHGVELLLLEPVQ